MSKKKSFKNRIDVVYSTNESYDYDENNEDNDVTLPPAEQNLKVHLESYKGGKKATVIRGFVGTKEDMSALAKTLKSKCGVGGSAKDGEIIIQGEHRDKIIDLLANIGYRAKKAGG